MTTPSDTLLSSKSRFSLNATYKRTDLPGIDKQTINLNGNFTWDNGAGKDRANLLYLAKRRLISSSEELDLDGILTNNWGQTLNYDSVKFIWLKNLETTSGRYLQFTFKSERGNIGALGYRVIVEPDNPGITAFTASGSAEEGVITLTSNADITYEIAIIGSHAESSSTGS